MRLLGELARRGHQTTVITPKWQIDWPEETDYAGVRVLRVPPPGQSVWSEAFYAGRLRRILRRQRNRYDVALVSGLWHDAATTLKSARELRFPVVIQPERPGLKGDCHRQIEARGGRRIKSRCVSADEFIALSPLLQRELTAAGYARTRIRLLTLGVPLQLPTTMAQRDEARRSLASADPALVLPRHAKLAVFAGRLLMSERLETLLEAWKLLRCAQPAILWICGDGPDRDQVRRKVIESGLLDRVKLVGAFDDVEDLFRAADLAVFPSSDEGPGVGLLEAASFGLPVVAAATASNCDLLSQDEELRLVSKDDPAAWASVVTELLDDAERARQMGAAARRRIGESYSLVAMVDAYERLLSEVAALHLKGAT